MSNDDFLGSFEQLVLLSIVRLRDNAYGMTVRKELEDNTERPTSLGAVYSTLSRLEEKGYISSYSGGASEVREGRAKRFFRVESSGLAALQRSLRIIESMSKGLRELRRPVGELQ